jgi:uncharacterized integral membrane protein
MSIQHRNQDLPVVPADAIDPADPADPADPIDTGDPADPAGAARHQALNDQQVTSPPSDRTLRRSLRTRAGTAWFAVCTAAAALVVLIVFMLQNTRSVEVTFLWMHGNVPLALALLIAGVSVAILAMAVGEVRISQLRRLARRPR